MSSTGSAMVWGKDKGKGEEREREREREREKRQGRETGSGKRLLYSVPPQSVAHNQEHVYLNWYFKQLFAVAMSSLCG